MRTCPATTTDFARMRGSATRWYLPRLNPASGIGLSETHRETCSPFPVAKAFSREQPSVCPSPPASSPADSRTPDRSRPWLRRDSDTTFRARPPKAIRLQPPPLPRRHTQIPNDLHDLLPTPSRRFGQDHMATTSLPRRESCVPSTAWIMNVFHPPPNHPDAVHLQIPRQLEQQRARSALPYIDLQSCPKMKHRRRQDFGCDYIAAESESQSRDLSELT